MNTATTTTTTPAATTATTGTILALDLGKFKTVARAYHAASAQARFHTIPPSRHHLHKLFNLVHPSVVVFETCALAGWVLDLCHHCSLTPRSPTPRPRPGNANTPNARPTRTMPSAWLNWKPWANSPPSPCLPSKPVNGLLVECAWAMLRYNAWARAVYARLSRGGKTRRKQAIVAVARKLLVRCWAMLRDGQPWRGDPAPLPQTAPA